VDVVPTAKVCARGRRLSPISDQDNVTEDDRERADRLISVRAVLDLEVQMRRQGVPRVADGADVLPAPHAFTLPHPHTSLLQVRQHRIAPVTDLEDDVVALTGRLPDRADGLVGLSVEDADDRAVDRSQNGLSETVPGGRAFRIAAVAAPVDEPHEVDGVLSDVCR